MNPRKTYQPQPPVGLVAPRPANSVLLLEDENLASPKGISDLLLEDFQISEAVVAAFAASTLKEGAEVAEGLDVGAEVVEELVVGRAVVDVVDVVVGRAVVDPVMGREAV